MDLNGFLTLLGDLTADKVSVAVSALINFWDKEMAWTADSSFQGSSLRYYSPGSPLVYSWAMCNEKTREMATASMEEDRDKSNKIWAKAHFKTYSLVMMVANKQHSSTTIMSAQCKPAELFQVARQGVLPKHSIFLLQGPLNRRRWLT